MYVIGRKEIIRLQGIGNDEGLLDLCIKNLHRNNPIPQGTPSENYSWRPYTRDDGWRMSTREID